MTHSYDAVFVILSVIVAILASFLAFTVISRATQSRASFARSLSEQTSLLRKSEEQYRVLFDHNPNPMWVYASPTLEFLAVNEAAIRRYGYTRDEFLAMSREEIRVKPDAAAAKGVTIPVESAGANGAWNGQHRKKNGTLIDVAVTSHEIDFDGREACLALPMDMTDRKRAEDALLQSEQRTRLIIDTALDAVVAMSSSGAISDWSAQAERMFGWSRLEAVGQQMSDLIIPTRYRDAHNRGLKKFLQTGEGPVLNKRIEITALSRDGREFPIELAISPARLGEDWTFSAFIRDLTERKKAEEALVLGERRYRDLFEDVPVGLYQSTPEGRLVDVNPAMVSMLGYPDRESLLATPAPLLYIDPEDRVRWTAQMTGDGVVLDFDVRMRRADGAAIWARDTTHVKRAPDGTALLYEGVLEDITERRLLESQLTQTSKMEAVGQLAGGVAHDFNNLLTVIMSCGAMLLDRVDLSDSSREDVSEITAAADRAAGLTRQLLAFSRQQVMQPRVMNINAVIGDLKNMLRRLIGEDVDLQISLDPEIATINADPGQLEQVLMNLVVNARDAMPAGGRLGITTSNSELSSETAAGTLHAAGGNYVMLAVSDTGTGMTAEVQQRLFDPFFTTKDHGRGTGLGLATVYGIVKQSDGEIYVYSELGQGSTFKIYFPRFTSSVELPPDEVRPKEVPRGEESVLVVEDDSNLRGLAARVLRNCGYTVYVAGGGVEALTIALDPATLIDAVVTDVVMPGMNGRELVERLIESRPGMRSLLMSGYTDDDILRRGVLHGETAFLQKPFTPEQLARKVRGVLDRS
jgi:two-component system, cell cycle sensor histidine kinase and response regulator CckA